MGGCGEGETAGGAQGRAGAFAPFNLKGKSRCRPAVGAAGRNVMDNHKSQDLRPGDTDQ
jgi:hypothetical protein